MKLIIRRIKQFFRICKKCKTCDHKWECRLKRNWRCYVLATKPFKNIGIYKDGKKIG